MKIITGINGFGRFGLHLLKYYLDRYDDSNFQISYINDDFLTINEARNIICNDTKVNFIRYKVLIEDNNIVIKTPEGLIHKFIYSCKSANKIPWMTKVHFLLECSGKNTDRNSALKLLNDNLAHVIISSTSQLFKFSQQIFTLPTGKYFSKPKDCTTIFSLTIKEPIILLLTMISFH